jgi:hypothetical protein
MYIIMEQDKVGAEQSSSLRTESEVTTDVNEASEEQSSSLKTESEGGMLQGVIDKLKEKKKLSDSSVDVYIRNLKKLNNDKPFNSFDFLKDVDVVLAKLSKYKETTKRNYLISIVSVISLFCDDIAIKEVHDKYYNLMMKKKEEITKKDEEGIMTETQADNWITWDQVKEKYKELETRVNTFYKKKNISPDDYIVLLAYAVLSCYVLIPPRRNKDYQLMNVVTSFDTELDKDHNYLDLTKKKFIFNNYKTSKKYGRYDMNIPNPLMKALKKYLKHRDLKFAVDDVNNHPLLIKPDGKPMNKSNDITKVLNKVFGVHIGSSMLRHIFVTDKYGDILKKSANDAKDMAHSVDEQRLYIKEKLVVKF